MSRLGDYDGAAALQRELISRAQIIHSDSSIQMANAWNNLAVTQTFQGKFDLAADAFRNALEIQRNLLGPEHQRVSSTMRNLGIVLGKLNRYEEGLALLRQALELRKNFSPESLGYMRAQYAQVLLESGNREEALIEGRQALALLEESTNATVSQRSDIWMVLSLIYLETGQPDLAETFAQQSFEARTSFMAPDHPKVAQAQCIYGLALWAEEPGESARDLLRACHDTYAGWAMANPHRVAEVKDILNSRM